jgi:hypothetical protein
MACGCADGEGDTSCDVVLFPGLIQPCMYTLLKRHQVIIVQYMQCNMLVIIIFFSVIQSEVNRFGCLVRNPFSSLHSELELSDEDCIVLIMSPRFYPSRAHY